MAEPMQTINGLGERARDEFKSKKDQVKKFAEDAKNSASDMAEEGIEESKALLSRVGEQAHETMDQWMSDSGRYIKRNPGRALGITLGVGVLLGAAVTALIVRRA